MFHSVENIKSTNLSPSSPCFFFFFSHLLKRNFSAWKSLFNEKMWRQRRHLVSLLLLVSSSPSSLPGISFPPPTNPFADEMDGCVPGGLSVAFPLYFCFRVRFSSSSWPWPLSPLQSCETFTITRKDILSHFCSLWHLTLCCQATVKRRQWGPPLRVLLTDKMRSRLHHSINFGKIWGGYLKYWRPEKLGCWRLATMLRVTRRLWPWGPNASAIGVVGGRLEVSFPVLRQLCMI